MHYRLLGRTGLKISELSLGTMTFSGGDTIGGVTQAEANEFVAHALASGINFFDTADVYSGGDAERLLGQALGARRKDVIIATKVRLGTGSGPNNVGLSRAHILNAVDDSLRRLDTDYIDIYQIHIIDAFTALEETLRALEDLVRWGKVRYIGCCNFPAWQLMKALSLSEANGWTHFASLQAHYSLAERGLERELVPLVQDQNLGLFVWSPLSGGLLSGKFTRTETGPAASRRSKFDFPPVNFERTYTIIDVMRDIAARHDVSVARIALAWLLHQDVVTSVIVGARRLHQLEDNLLAAAIKLSTEELQQLDAVSALSPEYPGWMLQRPWDERMST